MSLPYRPCFIAGILFTALFLTSCSDGAYLLQCAKGQWSLMSRARPIADILAEDTASQTLREQLAKVVSMREFAVSSLSLPDNGSYRQYADLERPYAVWNLVAAPEFSLDLNEWCYPITGCMTYRGYFDEEEALKSARHLSALGFDVDVYGVEAYSTLNWFADPVLNTFLDNDDMRLAGLLFHELSHQIIYVPNDTVFNESFAKTVELEGLRRWLEKSGSHDLWLESQQREEYSAGFHKLLAKTRSALQKAYAGGHENDRKRTAKEQILQRTFEDYEKLKVSWGGYAGYDNWMKRGLNNARLLSMATYYDLVPAFQALLVASGNDLERFYAEVVALGDLPKPERQVKLHALSPTLSAALH